MTPLRVQVKELREANDLTQGELAKRARVSRATVNRIENGRPKSIDLDVLERIAKALGVSPAALIVDTPPKAAGKRHR